MVATPRRTSRQGALERGNDRWGPGVYIPLVVALIGAIGTIVAALITSTPAPEPFPVPVPDSATEIPAAPSTQGVGCGDNLLAESWHLEATGGPAEAWIDFDPPYRPASNDGLRITYDLHGLRAREGGGRNDSVIVLTQPHWYGVSLATLSTNKNGFNGEQTAYIPLIDFHELPNAQEGIEGNRPLTWGKEVSSIRARFWDFDRFRVDIASIRFCRNR